MNPNIFTYATPLTREGVSQPSQLSREGQEAHYRRRGGPGTRRKNPARYDNWKKSDRG